jgi:hypothetical protein
MYISPPIRRYECYWEREASLGEEINSAWGMHKRPVDLGDVANNLKGVMQCLHAWSERTIGSISKQLERKRKELDTVYARTNENNKKTARKLSAEIDELLGKEEMRWRQRSRISWLRAGGRNTNYFHRRAKWRQKKKIEKLQTQNGNLTADSVQMKAMATEYFSELYKADSAVQPTIITQTLEQKVNNANNEALCADFTDEEISFALFQIGPTKAPEPNGFP